MPCRCRHLRSLLAGLCLAGGSAPAATAIRADGIPVQGSLESQDLETMPGPCDRGGTAHFRDIFTIEGLPGQPLDVTLVSSFDGYLYLFDPRGVEMARNDDAGNSSTSRITATLSQRGMHRIVVTTYSTGITGTYTLTVTAGASQPPSTVDAPITLGQTVTGTLVPGDAVPLAVDDPRGGEEFLRDGFALPVPSPAVVMIDLASDFDGYLILLDGGGRVVGVNDDHLSTRDSRIVAGLSPGPHRVIVTSYGPNTSGNYTLTVASGDTGVSPAELGSRAGGMTHQPITADAVLEFDVPVTGTLTEADNAALPAESSRASVGYHRDGYVFDGVAGEPIQIDFAGAASPETSTVPGLAPLSPSLDGYLILVAPSGAIEAVNDDFTSPADARIALTLSETGPHRVVVTSFGPNATGPYRLMLTAAPASGE